MDSKWSVVLHTPICEGMAKPKYCAGRICDVFQTKLRGTLFSGEILVCICHSLVMYALRLEEWAKQLFQLLLFNWLHEGWSDAVICIRVVVGALTWTCLSTLQVQGWSNLTILKCTGTIMVSPSQFVAQTVTLAFRGPPGVPGIFKGRVIGQSISMSFCGVCGYSTSGITWVKRHYMTHTGERPFECPNCEYASASKPNLKRHMTRCFPTGPACWWWPGYMHRLRCVPAVSGKKFIVHVLALYNIVFCSILRKFDEIVERWIGCSSDFCSPFTLGWNLSNNNV